MKKKESVKEQEVKQVQVAEANVELQTLERRVIAGIIIGNALHAVRNVVGYDWTDDYSKKLFACVMALDSKSEYISTFTVREKSVKMYGEEAPDMDGLINYMPNPASLVQLANKMLSK